VRDHASHEARGKHFRCQRGIIHDVHKHWDQCIHNVRFDLGQVRLVGFTLCAGIRSGLFLRRDPVTFGLRSAFGFRLSFGKVAHKPDLIVRPLPCCRLFSSQLCSFGCGQLVALNLGGAIGFGFLCRYPVGIGLFSGHTGTLCRFIGKALCLCLRAILCGLGGFLFSPRTLLRSSGVGSVA
jgi:hypothetical protein